MAQFSLLHITRTTTKKLLAIFIATYYKPENWYWAAYKYTGFLNLGKKKKAVQAKSSSRINHAALLNSVLSLLTRRLIPFPIPIEAKGFELFENGIERSMVLCSLHMPLIKVALRYMVDNGLIPDLAIANLGRSKLTAISLWGITHQIPAVDVGPFVLLRAKTVLQSGGCVVALTDKELGGPVSPNIFILAHKLNAPVAYFTAQLMPNGHIEVSFIRSTVIAADAGTAAKLQIADLEKLAGRIVDDYRQFK